MTHDQTGRDAIYAMGYTEDELRRLTDQGQLYASSTRALLLDAGIGHGMHVLDVGCGPGDVSLLVAERVGASGEVIGVDTNERVLQLARARVSASGFTQARFVNSDLREFPADTLFDAVVGRFVLMYLADPADVVRRVAQYVRPGGAVAFQEFQFEFTSLGSAPLPLFEQFRSWGLAVFRRAGVDTSIGLKLRQIFLDAGLPGPSLQLDGYIAGPGDELAARVVANSLRSALPLVEQFGIATAAEVDIDTFAQRYLAELNTSGAVHMLPPTLSAWTRTPNP
ncbi:MAG: class I SAM-dependent methyltransferase [Chloroflexi bacterium]|nr:class I SAM-dependent methyltransferase [Chloroflexota bacterium]